MPELPDITAYQEALKPRILGQRFDHARILKPFFLRTAVPPLDAAFDRSVIAIRRLGKRIAIGLDDDYWLVVHLMIAGRFQWVDADAPARKPTRNTLAAFRFEPGSLIVTEAGTLAVVSCGTHVSLPVTRSMLMPSGVAAC